MSLCATTVIRSIVSRVDARKDSRCALFPDGEGGFAKATFHAHEKEQAERLLQQIAVSLFVTLPLSIGMAVHAPLAMQLFYLPYSLWQSPVFQARVLAPSQHPAAAPSPPNDWHGDCSGHMARIPWTGWKATARQSAS